MRDNLRLVSAGSPDTRRLAESASRIRFIRARRSLGWSQLRASQELRVSVDAVELWERGKRRLPAWALVAIEGGRELSQVGGHGAAGDPPTGLLWSLCETPANQGFTRRAA